MKNFLVFMILFPFITYSQADDHKKDTASEETKKGMDVIYLSFFNELQNYKGDFSRTILDTLKNGKIRKIKIKKIMTSGDTISYAMMISISDQTETLSIIRNRPPDFWYGYRIEKSTGYARDRYKSGYINDIETLDSLLIPVRKEYALIKEYKEKDKKQEETLVSK